MKNKFIIFIYLLLLSFTAKTQNNSLVINGAYIVMNGGTFTKNIQLVVNQGNQNGIVRNSGHIITESQYNYINWKTGATTGNYIFPTGYTISDYLPVSLNKTTSSSSDIKTSTWGTPATNLVFADSSAVAACTNMNSIYGGSALSSVIDRWWDITSSSAMTADITFNYRGAENTTISPNAPIAAQQWNGGQWLQPIGSSSGVTSGIGSLTANGITNFSPFVLVNSNGLLPIELLSFKGSCINGAITLYWETASELNNDYFTIEKSTDAINWELSAIIDGGGTSTQAKNYSYTDKTISRDADIIYYRLKQTDYDGKNISFPPIGVAKCNEDVEVLVYPNPASEILFIKSTKTNTSYETSLTSSDGKLIFNGLLADELISLNISEIAQGIYFLTIIEKETNKKTVKKIIKQ